MTSENRKLKIVVLDDSDFFNRLITRQLESYTDALALNRKYDFIIESYVDHEDFIRNLKEDTDIAFIDYYLGSSTTGADILKKIKQKCKNCKVVIVSQARNINTAMRTITEGAEEFIEKDKNVLSNTCFFIENFLNKRMSYKWAN